MGGDMFIRVIVEGYLSGKQVPVFAQLRTGKWRDYLIISREQIDAARQAVATFPRDESWIHPVEGWEEWSSDLDGNAFAPRKRRRTAKVFSFPQQPPLVPGAAHG